MRLESEGATQVSANFEDITQLVPVQVTPATLEEIQVQPANQTLPNGLTCLVAAGETYEVLAEALPPNT